MNKPLFIAIIALALTGCRPNESQRGYDEKIVTAKLYAPKVDKVRFPPPVVKSDSEAEDDIASNNTLAQTAITDTSKKVTKEGTVEFKTENIAKTRLAIMVSVKKLGGYIFEEKENNDTNDSTHRYTLETRIPAKYFEVFLNDVTANAIVVDSKEITIADVTTQFIDMSTRLRNKKLLETRYLGLLKKASKMSDVLDVENKLNEISTDIESAQGQLNYLNKQIAYSSLSITFYNKQINGVDSDGLAYKFRKSFRDCWQIAQGLFFGAIALCPVIVLLIIGTLIFRRWRSRRKAKANAV